MRLIYQKPYLREFDLFVSQYCNDGTAASGDDSSGVLCELGMMAANTGGCFPGIEVGGTACENGPTDSRPYCGTGSGDTTPVCNAGGSAS